MAKRIKGPPLIIAAASCAERSHRYPNSDESTGHEWSIGRYAGLLRIGANLMRLLHGARSPVAAALATV